MAKETATPAAGGREEQRPPESNRMEFCFPSRSENVALARLLTAAVAALRDTTVAELDEIKVAVSEAVSNAIIHGYGSAPDGVVRLTIELTGDRLTVSVHDDGVGIADIEQAMRPAFSSDSERMGLGFAFMQTFMDEVQVTSAPQDGTTVVLRKALP